MFEKDQSSFLGQNFKKNNKISKNLNSMNVLKS